MRFKIDENLPVEAAQLLNAAGHEAATTRSASSSRTPG
jgi:predicted nuclease of predicted toxin-antitoxin system